MGENQIEYVLFANLYNSFHRMEKISCKLIHLRSANKLLNVLNGTELTELPNIDIELAKLVVEMLEDDSYFETNCAELEKRQERTIKEYKTDMQLFILTLLPTALIKREYDQKLSMIESAMLLEIIPDLHLHKTWKTIVSFITKVVKRIQKKYCRYCGNKYVNMCCAQCGIACYCDVQCKKEDMFDKIMGHYSLECKIIKKK